jgi:hypothetical protein
MRRGNQKGGSALKRTAFVSGFLSLALAFPALADVTYKQETKMSGMMKMFNRDEKTVTRISGDEMRTESNDGVQIIDLAAEKIYNLDKKKKTYTVMTFAEMKKRMEEGMASAKKGEGEEGAGVRASADFKVTETGNADTIKGFACKQYLMEMNVDVKDQESAQEGSLSTLTEMWLTQEAPGIDEINAFHRKMASKIGTTEIGSPMMEGDNEQANTFAFNMRQMVDEMKKLDGFTIKSIMYFGSPEAAKKEALGGGDEGEEQESGGGGGFGGFMKKMKMPGMGGGASGGGVLMKVTTEVDEIETKAVDPSQFVVPEDYKQVEK